MVKNINQTYSSDHFSVSINIEIMYCTSETNNNLYQLYLYLKKKKIEKGFGSSISY